MYIHIEIDRKPKIGNFGNEGGGIKLLTTLYILLTPLWMPAISRVCSSYN